MAKLVPNYTEDAVSIAVQILLSGASFPFSNFSVLPFSKKEERWLGADAIVTRNVRKFLPFYMQFKRPCAYKSDGKSKILGTRTKLGLENTEHVLFFELRKKKKNHVHLQHNILYRLNKRLVNKGLGCAAYVCPLFLDRIAYFLSMQGSAFEWLLRSRRFRPWHWEEQFINDSNGRVRFDRIPTFNEHISIPPHAEVVTADHLYSFTDRGEDVCFHSPLKLEGDPLSLGMWLKDLSGIFHDEGIKRENMGKELSSLKKEIGFSSEAASSSDMSSWLEFGDFLSRTYDIEQFAFLEWSEV